MTELAVAGTLPCQRQRVTLYRFLGSFAALAVVAIGLRTGVYAWLALPYGGLVSAMCQFDCGWYERIAVAGYGANAEWADFGSYPHWAFFPLYPLVVSLLHRFLAISGLAISELAMGMGVSAAALCGFTIIGARYLRETRLALQPWLWLIVALLFPYGFFFSAVYTEALFAMLSTGALLALQQRRFLLAAGMSALASATRPTGILLTPILAINRLAAFWRGRHRHDRLALLGETLLPIAVAPLGLFLYMLYQYSQVGDALAFSHVQVLWQRQWGNPFTHIWDGLRMWDFAVLLANPSSAYSASFALLGLAGAIWLLLRRRSAEAAFLAGCVLLPVASGLDSLPRYVAANPVFLFVVYDFATALIGRSPKPVGLVASAAALGILQLVLLIGWLHGAGGIF